MRLKRPLILLLISTLLGCATMQQECFSSAPASVSNALADECVKPLVSLYPPAHTRVYIKQSANDSFGLSLIETLRQRGYSINEAFIKGSSAPNPSDVVLYYLVDEPIKGALYRVTLRVGQQSFSRAYTIKNGLVSPLGFWVHKE